MKQRDEAIIKEFTQRRTRTITLLLVIGALIVCAGLLRTTIPSLRGDTIGIAMLIIIIPLAFYSFMTLQCPACSGLVRKLSTRYCPHCGVQLRDP